MTNLEIYGAVEQRSARLPVTEKVAGSNPVSPAIIIYSMKSLIAILGFFIGLYLSYLAIASDTNFLSRILLGAIGLVLIVYFVRTARND